MNFVPDDHIISYTSDESYCPKADQTPLDLLSPTLDGSEITADLCPSSIASARKSTDASEVECSRFPLSSFTPPKGAHRVGAYLVGPVDENTGLRRAVSTLNPSAGKLDCFVVTAQDGYRQLSLRVHLNEPDWLPSIVDTLIVGVWTYFFCLPTYGCLLDEFGGVSFCGMKESRVADIFGQMVDIVHHCHNHGVILRDLTLRCFVFQDEARTTIKLLTISKAEIGDVRCDRFACRFYACPEMFIESRSSPGAACAYSGKGADVWSLGVMLYALLVGCYPFFNSQTRNVSQAVTSGQLRIPQGLSFSAVRLLLGILERDPARRVTTAAILHHPFLVRRKPTWTLSLLVNETLSEESLLVPSAHEIEPPKLVW